MKSKMMLGTLHGDYKNRESINLAEAYSYSSHLVGGRKKKR